MTKIVCQLDAQEYYMGTTVAEESPLEQGVFLLPSGCVDMDPPYTTSSSKKYKLVGGVWVEESIVANVPSSISKFQAKAALLLSDKLESVEEYMINASPVDRLAWENVQEFKRDSPTLKRVASVLNLSNQQVDEMFIAASQIEA